MIAKSTKRAKEATLNVSRDIISGLIDVDRISYLVHDSQRAGVNYGKGIDLGALIDNLTIRRFTQDEDAALAIEEAGVSAVESVLSAVYWMYKSVYWREPNRAFMAALKFAVRHLIKNNELLVEKENRESQGWFKDYLDATHGRDDWFALRYVTDAFDRLMMVRKNTARWINPLTSIERRHGNPYRCVFSLAYDRPREGDDVSQAAKSEERSRVYDDLVGHPSIAREERIIEGIAGKLPRDADPKPGEILVDIPLKRRLHTDGGGARLKATRAEDPTSTALSVRQYDYISQTERWTDIFEYSTLAQSLGRVEDRMGRKIRIFFHEELIARLNMQHIEPAIYAVIAQEAAGGCTNQHCQCRRANQM